MKKILILIVLFVSSSVFFVACEKEAIEGTKTEKMAGEWYVTASAVDKKGKVVYDDAKLFKIGYFKLDTYNTAKNTSDTMWISDNGHFKQEKPGGVNFNFKVKVSSDINALTFSAKDVVNVANDTVKVTIEKGQILEGAATTPRGMPADSINFVVKFDNDGLPAKDGFYGYRIEGFRYTGFTEDNE